MWQGDYYTLLEVPVSATAAEIKKAYHRLALRYHPDRNPGNKDAGERFRRIAEAYATLSDSDLRAGYDKRHRGEWMDSGGRVGYPAWLDVTVSAQKVELNSEVEVCFSFPSEGRIFRKPTLQGWEICSGPAVSHRVVEKEGVRVRETVLRYVLCPLSTGYLEIPSASIRFGVKPVYSAAYRVESVPAPCCFIKGQQAGSRPVRIPIHREVELVTGNLRKTFIHRHTILLPRSDLAARYHDGRRLIRLTATLAGGLFSVWLHQPVLIGLAAGNLLGALSLDRWLRFRGVRTLQSVVWKHPLILKYEAAGYVTGYRPMYGWMGSKGWMKLKMWLS